MHDKQLIIAQKSLSPTQFYYILTLNRTRPSRSSLSDHFLQHRRTDPMSNRSDMSDRSDRSDQSDQSDQSDLSDLSDQSAKSHLL